MFGVARVGILYNNCSVCAAVVKAAMIDEKI